MRIVRGPALGRGGSRRRSNELEEIPEKPYYKVAEICKYTETQPYVLRFWESEFPQLSARKDRGGQRVYTREDLQVVLRIKQLLYEQEYTIADARRLLIRETESEDAPRVSPAILEPGEWVPETEIAEAHAPAAAVPVPVADSYRASYEAARDEVARLKLRLAEVEERSRQLEQELSAAQDAVQAAQLRSEKVAERLSALLEAMTNSKKSAS